MNTIVLTGGGIAGHIMPSIALLPQLKEVFDEVYFIGGDGMEKDIVSKYDVPFFSVPSQGLNRKNMLKNLKLPKTLFKGVIEAKKLLKKISPKVVFSKGGYAALPVVLAASNLGIPVVSHESDLTVGLSNKIALAKGARLLTSFPQTLNDDNRAEYTGFPVRAEILSGNANLARQIYGIKSHKPVLLIVGGSSGSVAINKTVWSCLPSLTKHYFVVHIKGKNWQPPSEADNYLPMPYCPDIQHLYAFIGCGFKGGSRRNKRA